MTQPPETVPVISAILVVLAVIITYLLYRKYRKAHPFPDEFAIPETGRR